MVKPLPPELLAPCVTKFDLAPNAKGKDLLAFAEEQAITLKGCNDQLSEILKLQPK